MIHAALNGKLACLGSEDALTASVLGLLRYLPDSQLIRWVRTAAPTNAAAQHTIESLSGPVNVEFWPRWPDALRGTGLVEPDAVLHFADHTVVLEAKLHAGKSGAPPGPGDEPPGDQLARQWVSALSWRARHREFGRPAVLLYVTAHLKPPTFDLAQSLKALEAAGVPDAPLAWLPWSTLEEVLLQFAADGIPARIRDDLIAYLDAADVLRYRGWTFSNVEIAASSTRWQYTRPTSTYFTAMSAPRGPAWRYRKSRRYFGSLVFPAGTRWSYSSVTHP